MKRHTFKHYLIVFFISLAFMIVLGIVAYSRKDIITGSHQYIVSSSVKVSGAMANTFNIFGKEFVLGLFLIDMVAVFGFPLALTLVFFLLDLGRGRVGKKKPEQIEKEKFESFVDSIGRTLNQTHKFNVEDFRHFRENSKFQEALKRLYNIYLNGETEECSYFSIMRKFNKGTQEREAMEFLITFTERKRVDEETKRALQKEQEEMKSEENK